MSTNQLIINEAKPLTLSNEEIAAELGLRIGKENVFSGLMERTAKAGDASIYRLVPRVVVYPQNESDVIAIINYCLETGLYLTFRAAGTSLSGQAVTDGILVDISHGWKGIRLLEDGKSVAMQPGLIAAHANGFLAPYNLKIGPDPASINACMIGGVAANNASGMCCGVEFNTYHTLKDLRFILADGYVVDTSLPDADIRLKADKSDLYNGLLQIRSRLLAKEELAEKVRRKFRIKNTCGLTMNSFTDYEKPIDILAHLMIGSEGTLGFISEVTLNTLPEQPLKSTALVYFADVVAAGKSIFDLERAGADVVEIMDRCSLLSVVHEMNYPFEIGDLTHEPTGIAENGKPIVFSNCAALLIEFQEDNEDRLEAKLEETHRILSSYELLSPIHFTRDAAVRNEYWHMRKGLFPSVGAMRQIGSAVIIEDVCVEPRYLAEAIVDIQNLFVKHHFPDAIIFGHARNGNIHFVICTDFGRPEQVTRYDNLMDELTRTIVEKYEGSLKAEHGTGRNIAPFVELEWGTEITNLMWDVKNLLDPANILNPGVVLTHDPQAHLKNLKVMPAVSAIVDKCIECGFCEPRCPSRDLTLTPRQRIAVLREVERLETLGDAESVATAEALLKDYEYYGKETCAADGMCATACPVKINTGELVKELRSEDHSKMARSLASVLAGQLGLITTGTKLGLNLIDKGGKPIRTIADVVMGAANKVSGGKIPKLPHGIPLPKGASGLPAISTEKKTGGKVVYFATCLTRTFGSISGEGTQVSLAEAVVKVLEACGREVVYPKGIANQCCGQPFFSKGFTEAGVKAATETFSALWEATEHGKYPVVCDTSPCSGQFKHCDKYLTGETLQQWKSVKIYDMSSYVAQVLIPERTDWRRLSKKVYLHPTCTVMKEGWTGDLTKVANTFADDVEIPVLAECCGFAGDRGFLFPELTLSATRPEATEVLKRGGVCSLGNPADGVSLPECNPAPGEPKAYYSTCRTCEIGMAAGTGEVYSNLIHLVYESLAADGLIKS